MSESNSSRTSVPFFMRNASESKINALSDIAQGLFLTLHSLAPETGETLRWEIADTILSELMFDKGTAPFFFSLDRTQKLFDGSKRYSQTNSEPINKFYNCKHYLGR